MYESYESGPRLCEVARRNLCDSSSGSNGYYDTGGDPEVKANILVNELTAEFKTRGEKSLHPGSTSFLSFSTPHPKYYRKPR